MNIPQAQQTAAPGLSRNSAGITVRPPRVLVVNQPCSATADEPIDPGRVRRLVSTGGYTHPPAPAVIVYRLSTGQHRQTGVVVEVSVDDYRNGRIRRHEATQPERERHLDELTETTGIEQMPVTLTHPGRPWLRSLLTEISAEKSDVHFTSADGTSHTVWVRHDADLAQAVQDEIGHIETLYIADGHHRMAAAERYANRRSGLGEDHVSAFTLAALFPSDEMRILGYHRCLPLPEGTSAPEVLERLAAQPATARVEECTSVEAAHPAPGVVVIHLDGRYYRLWLRTPPDPDHARGSLDVVTLDEELLPPVFGTSDVDSRPRSTPACGTGDAACWCTRREAICFLLHPPSVKQVMAVSDAGLVMPAKSTWFAPKANARLFVRELNQ